MMHADPLTIGIPKGRLMKSVSKHFKRSGVDISVTASDARAIITTTSEPDLQICSVRSKDVGLLLQAKALDMAVVGSDVYFETSEYCFSKKRALNICGCRMSLLGLPETRLDLYKNQKVKVATKYPRATHKYFEKLGMELEIIKLHGSTEFALLSGLAPLVVDIVSTGATIARNNLIELDVISHVSAIGLISHRVTGERRKRCDAYLQKIQLPISELTDIPVNKIHYAHT